MALTAPRWWLFKRERGERREGHSGNRKVLLEVPKPLPEAERQEAVHTRGQGRKA